MFLTAIDDASVSSRLMQDMASAPPMETGGFVGLPQPPSYEESVGPQYQGAVLPPAYTKSAQYPYPTQPYSQIYQPTAHSTTSPIVSVQTIYVQPGVVFGDLPVQTHCPACAQMVITRLEHTSGTMAWLTCAGLFIFGCIYGCCLLPFCVDGLKDVTHRCPNCNNVLGEHKRL
ncbi:lipopolysaccharide-induced tumor necrosis factor-alpha factor homolog isoform X1 [Salmo salar]|uniref:Lipopolysaccharide-induced tumor necrosis factor-alpha factor homolog isoform X1 n=3 Tax=Salmo TaxID=8028 RepID=A0ABM3EZJ9_SALSA|nr:lipopolysaccharide-induced tumor necrosis factor-alpha factor homolog isoform X1 [Salmo salar]